MQLLSPIAEFGLPSLAAAAAVMLAAGFVKGAVGFALPLIAIGGLGSFLPAQEAVAVMIFPTFLTNFWQTVRQGRRRGSRRARRRPRGACRRRR